MSAGRYTINVDQYATFNLALVWQDSSGNPINLTGYTANLTVQDEASNLLLTLSTSNSEIVLGGSAGTITLALTPTITSAFTPGTYKYDLLVTNSGTKTRLLEGAFIVEQGVTIA